MTAEISMRYRRALQEVDGYVRLLSDISDFGESDDPHRSAVARRALQCLDSLEEDLGVSFECEFFRGMALRAVRRYEQAVVAFNKALALEPTNIQTSLALGWCHKRIGRLDQSITTLEKGLKYHPQDPTLNYNLACYWCIAGDKDRSLAYLKTALTLEPSLREAAMKESDFDPLRNTPAFEHLTLDSIR